MSAGIDDFFKAFYATSDDGIAHEKYTTFFTDDAKLIMGDKTAVGQEEILALRRSMWERVSSRRHSYTYFTSPELPNTYLLTGTAKYGLKDGNTSEVDWVAKAELKGEGEDRKMDFYQVFLNAGRK